MAADHSLRWEEAELRLRDVFTTTHSASALRRNFIVAIRDAGGRTGWGEAAPYYDEDRDGIRSDLDRLQFRIAAGIDPLQAVGELRVPAKSMRGAVESAVLDLHAQRRGVPLGLHLGTEWRPSATSFTLGQAEPETMRRKAGAALAAGHRILKIKVGTPHDEANVALVRSLAPDAVIRVDANGGWTPEAALAVIPKLAAQGVELVEQPLPKGDPGAMAELRAGLRSRMGEGMPPLFVDESIRTPADIAAHAGIADGVVLKLSKNGGPGAVVACIAAARRTGMRVMIGCMVESSVGITVAAHLAPSCDMADLDGHLLLENDPFAGAEWREGMLQLPESAGTGIRVRGGDPVP